MRPRQAGILLHSDTDGVVVDARSGSSRLPASSALNRNVSELYLDGDSHRRLMRLLGEGASIDRYGCLLGGGFLAFHELADGRLTYDAFMDFGGQPFAARVVERRLLDEDGNHAGHILVVSDASDEYGPCNAESFQGSSRHSRMAALMIEAHPSGAAVIGAGMRVESANDRYNPRLITDSVLEDSILSVLRDKRPLRVSSSVKGGQDALLVPLDGKRVMLLQVR